MGIVLSLLSSFGAYAADYKCAPETWVTPPQMAGDNFSGNLSTTCVITGAAVDGIALLGKYMEQNITSGNAVNAGPTAETFEGMPSTYYDITFSDSQTTVRSDEHLATDLSDKLVFSTTSKQTSGKGWASLLKGLNIRVEVTKLPEPRSYQLILTTLTLVKRPFYAPTPAFVKTAPGPTQTQFEKQRDQLLPEYVKALAGN